MDDRQSVLQKKLESLLKDVADVEVELSRVDGSIVGIPHYSVIESRAHYLGRQLSREIQQRQMGEAAASAAGQAKCPLCGTLCDLEESKRPMTSIDGEFPLQELTGHCPSCRRAFFPSASEIGL